MGRPTKERKTLTQIHIQPSLLIALQDLSVRTRVPRAELIREGIEMVLKARNPKPDTSCLEGGAHRFPEGVYGGSCVFCAKTSAAIWAERTDFERSVAP